MSNNLKRLREERGITQKEFAKMLGVSVAHLNKIENNAKHSRNLTAARALKAAKLLNVSMDEIFLK